MMVVWGVLGCPCALRAASLPVVSGLVLVAGLVSASGVEAQPRQLVFEGATMGTTFTVKVISSGPDEPAESDVRRVVSEALEEVDALMSTWQPDSELSRFNRWNETTFFQLSEPVFEAFRLALDASERSGGAFDITVGPLVDAWGFGPDGRSSTPPTDETVRGLLGATGYRHLELDGTTRAVRKTRPDIHCDLSGVAKGYGVDRAAEALDRLGIESYMVEVGGEIRTRGSNLRDQPWQLAIQNPVGTPAIHRIVAISDASLATSGDYRNHYDLEGRRVSHTIDPRVGRPIEHALTSVSVVHPQCALADAFATALMVLGPEEGWELAVREELAALFLIRTADGDLVERMSPAFASQYSPEERRAEGASSHFFAVRPSRSTTRSDSLQL